MDFAVVEAMNNHLDDRVTAHRVVESIQTALLLFNSRFELCYINVAGELLLSVSARRAIGAKAEELLPNKRLLESLEEVMAHGHLVTERELVVTLPLQRRITVDITATRLVDQGLGDELLVEINQVDRQLRIVKEEGLLVQSIASRALARGLAHEIKNPLGGLRGAAQLLERELHSEALKEYTGIIIGEADRLQLLIDRMLGPNTLPRKGMMNIHEVLERVRLLSLAEGGGVAIIQDYDPSIPEFPADKDQLIQAFLNLTQNAIQATAEGRGEVVLRSRTLRQYTIGQRRYKLVVKVEIIDNGCGIDEKMMESIFLPMVTGRAEGTGLGLPIAQSLINLNEGFIECDSDAHQTTFSVLLPLLNYEQGWSIEAERSAEVL